jgi:hypothetical protein
MTAPRSPAQVEDVPLLACTILSFFYGSGCFNVLNNNLKVGKPCPKACWSSLVPRQAVKLCTSSITFYCPTARAGNCSLRAHTKTP